MEKDNTFHPHGHGNDSFDVNRTTMPGARDRKPDGRFEVGDLILGRYKVLSELGQGGMGVVYKCLDETAGIEIALKALPPELSHNTLEMEDVKDNFQLVSKLVHQNIAISKNLEIDKATGNYYLIMECVAGEDLRRWIKRKRRECALTLEAVLPVVRQVAAALDYAHEEKIIHRDIKPGNIMIDAAGHVKVLDFGLAAQIHTSMTRVSMAYRGTSGTAPYMAPEQWEGDAQGAPADQYALAVMTYEMLAGRLPFESPDVSVLREAVLKGTAKPIDGIPKYAQQALDRAMSKDPAARFPSCTEFVSALEGKKGSAAKNRHGKGVAFALASAAAIFLLVGAGIMWRTEIIKLVSGSKEKSTPAGRTERDNTFSEIKRDKQPRKQENAFQTTEETKHAENETRQDSLNLVISAAREAKSRAEWDQYVEHVEKAMSIAPTNEQVKELVSEAGDTISFLAWEYETGVSVKEDKINAVKWYLKASDLGCDVRERLNGFVPSLFLFKKKNETDELMEMFHKDAERGNADAQVMLSAIYCIPYFYYYDSDKAVKWARKAAEQRDAGAQIRLGLFYDNGEGVSQNYAIAVKWYLRAANQGDRGAQYILGTCYAKGQGVTKDDTEAAKWYSMAAEQGDADAQYELGECYSKGLGVAKDEAETVKWFRKAAAQGHKSAQYTLGECYAKGQGVAKDETEAVKWYLKAIKYGGAHADRAVVEWFCEHAERGNADAQAALAWCYANGYAIIGDVVEAVDWYRKAANQGQTNAQYELAECYAKGQGIKKNEAEAAKWYLKAADQKNVNAQFKLAECYAKGQGIKKDETEAVKWYRKAAESAEQGDDDLAAEIFVVAEQGNPYAQCILGCHYMNELVSDYFEAVNWFREAAARGDASAQCNLGECYMNGQGVAKDEDEAVKWYRKAADQGHAKAQYNLGNCYYSGNGVAQDYDEAVKWYRKAAEQGLADAQYILGDFYYYGHWIAKDEAEAVKWYRKAADQGFFEAQWKLGICYEHGQGVTRNDAEAVKWYRKAAEQGDADAQKDFVIEIILHHAFLDDTEAVEWYRKEAEWGDAKAQWILGCCYEYGRGVAKDEDEAVKWYRKAAEQGFVKAQWKLGICYEYGRGAVKDEAEAVKWYRKAAEQGNEAAKTLLEDLGY